MYLYNEARFADQSEALGEANNSSSSAATSAGAIAPGEVELVPIDSVVQTARIVTSFARRDLAQLATFEPEGAEYVPITMSMPVQPQV